jgi:hypothetical protein
MDDEARAAEQAPLYKANSVRFGYNSRPFQAVAALMIELNPIRQRIADLTGRLDALRGYL